MNVSIDGVRLNVARSFNELYQEFSSDWDNLSESQKLCLYDLRMHIANLLIIYTEDGSMTELSPDKFLLNLPCEDD